MNTTQSHSYMFEMTLEIVLFITFRTKKTYVQDVLDDVVSGATGRTVQRYLSSLEKQGYLIGDNEIPRGFRPSDKAKQLFGANP